MNNTRVKHKATLIGWTENESELKGIWMIYTTCSIVSLSLPDVLLVADKDLVPAQVF